MKPIKIFCLLIILFCPLYGSENKNIEDYFLKIHANEKLEFLECVKKEDASPAQKVNTKCEISSAAKDAVFILYNKDCLLYTSPSPRDGLLSRMPSSA